MDRKLDDKRRGNAGKGRPKGSPNKVTADLKSMILGALEGVGGQSYLETQANKSPTAFLALIGKVLPTEVKAEVKVDATVINDHDRAKGVAALLAKARKG